VLGLSKIGGLDFPANPLARRARQRGMTLAHDRLWQSFAATLLGWGGMWAMALSDDPPVTPAWPAALFWAGLAVAALEQRRRHQQRVREALEF
jgi:hypothetical protein